MKTILASLLGTLLCLASPSHAVAFQQSPQTGTPVQQDTITIEIGADKKVIILVRDKQALRSLQQYDLNKMVRELNIQAEAAGTTQTIIITDEEGKRYRVAGSETGTPSGSDTTQTNEEVEVEIVVEEMEKEKGEFNVVFNSRDKNRKKDFSRTRSSLLFDLGMNNYLQDGAFPQENDAQYAVRPWGSWYVGVNKAFTTQLVGPLALQWGGGLSWYNFKFEDPSTRMAKQDGQIVFTQEQRSEIHSDKSKLTASFVNVHAVPMLDFGYRRKVVQNEDGTKTVQRWHQNSSFRIGLGGYAGYRLGSYTKIKFEENNDTKKDRNRSDYYLNNWRYGARLQVGIKGVDLFAQYDLNDLFSGNRAPQLNAFSFGVTF
ncbi:hypothetical protein [Cesiribacter andamanensis]|uniref:Outer membrane protein beta-barrel domain-containing protein n=1 Tax=Cesiribacter andamanensis AMV16 TaxID=1279009 RepID=M7P0J9_9BACT|nr:hypothetical protein [Cesiribacter andamanensis]EMR04124.1 hypothetical protein ADICEAN_00747 [Cesiribacter andamanensis AMV16]